MLLRYYERLDLIYCDLQLHSDFSTQGDAIVIIMKVARLGCLQLSIQRSFAYL